MRHGADLPIADYALISDCHSAALVSSGGSIDWLCFPRFDSPSVFGRILDLSAGHWSIRPVGEARTTRRYLDATMVLETTFSTQSGSIVLRDALAFGRNERGHDLGAEAPHAILRTITCTQGPVDIEMEYAAKPEFGLVAPLLKPLERGVLGSGSSAVLLLSTPTKLRIDQSAARAMFSLETGAAIGFALQYRSTQEEAPSVWTEADIFARMADTIEGWRSWSRMHQRYEGPWAELVSHSGRVLQALTFYPTGAIVAAPTTSLPETVGGVRNWDYRFTWIRDASFTLEALWVAACPDEASKFLEFLTSAALTQIRGGADLRIMFGIGGEHDLTEREIPHLTGWRRSRPVRIGNGAWNQRQLDVYGELMSAVHLLKAPFKNIDETTREFLCDVVDAAANRWKEKDHGIWEMRDEPRHFLYSKLMCWVALDRGIWLADMLRASDRIERWHTVRQEIRNAILEQGWSDRAGAFTQAFGSDDLDASALMLLIVGFLPRDDPRIRATVEAVSARLTDQRGLVYRYRCQDGLPGEEGAFLLCTFWLAQAWALVGEMARAREVFSRAVAFANDVGLLAEQLDPTSRELLGNFPQAFSHIGLINAAWAISRAEANPQTGRTNPNAALAGPMICEARLPHTT
jgi:GH15 family glucan-1,4-alpha-glucosidase